MIATRQRLELITIIAGTFGGCLLGGMFYILGMKIGIELSMVVLLSVVGSLAGLLFWLMKKVGEWSDYLNEINPEGPFTFLSAWRLLRKRGRSI